MIRNKYISISSVIFLVILNSIKKIRLYTSVLGITAFLFINWDIDHGVRGIQYKIYLLLSVSNGLEIEQLLKYWGWHAVHSTTVMKLWSASYWWGQAIIFSRAYRKIRCFSVSNIFLPCARPPGFLIVLSPHPPTPLTHTGRLDNLSLQLTNHLSYLRTRCLATWQSLTSLRKDPWWNSLD